MKTLSTLTAALLLVASALSWWLGIADKVPATAFVVEESTPRVPAARLDDLVDHVARQGLQYNSELAGVLEPVAEAAKGEPDEVHQRMAELVSLAWPSSEGVALSGLMLTYIRYHDQVSRLQARPDLSARERLEAVVELQSMLFGDKAPPLFAERNRMMSAIAGVMEDD
jgi:hypothetical protein